VINGPYKTLLSCYSSRDFICSMSLNKGCIIMLRYGTKSSFSITISLCHAATTYSLVLSSYLNPWTWRELMTSTIWAAMDCVLTRPAAWHMIVMHSMILPFTFTFLFLLVLSTAAGESLSSINHFYIKSMAGSNTFKILSPAYSLMDAHTFSAFSFSADDFPPSRMILSKISFRNLLD